MATKVIALHTVIRTLKPGVAATRDTPAVRPVTEELKPGTVFVIDNDNGPTSELAELLAAKAVSTEVKSGVVHTAAAALDGPGEPVVKVEALTADAKAKLIARGKELNIKGIATADTWKDATLTKKVAEAEAEAAARDSAKPNGEQPLV